MQHLFALTRFLLHSYIGQPKRKDEKLSQVCTDCPGWDQAVAQVFIAGNANQREDRDSEGDLFPYILV